MNCFIAMKKTLSTLTAVVALAFSSVQGASLWTTTLEPDDTGLVANARIETVGRGLPYLYATLDRLSWECFWDGMVYVENTFANPGREVYLFGPGHSLLDGEATFVFTYHQISKAVRLDKLTIGTKAFPVYGDNSEYHAYKLTSGRITVLGPNNYRRVYHIPATNFIADSNYYYHTALEIETGSIEIPANSSVTISLSIIEDELNIYEAAFLELTDIEAEGIRKE